MITLKYFGSFLESEKNEFGEGAFNYEINNPEPKSWNYDGADNSFLFHFLGVKGTYSLRVFPQFEIFCLTLPDINLPEDKNFVWCSFAALTNAGNREFFINYEKGFLYRWMLRTILYVQYKIHIEVEGWLDKSDKEQED